MGTTNFDTVAASFTGNLTGNVTGNVTGYTVPPRLRTPGTPGLSR